MRFPRIEKHNHLPNSMLVKWYLYEVVLLRAVWRISRYHLSFYPRLFVQGEISLACSIFYMEGKCVVKSCPVVWWHLLHLKADTAAVWNIVIIWGILTYAYGIME